MKITDLKVWLTKPKGSTRTYVFLRIDTDEGVSGFGEATSSGGGGSVVVGHMLRLLRDSTVAEDFRESLIGQDPENVDLIWHKLFRRFTGGGGHGGFVTTMISGVDIALWDIKGKAAGKPIYRLFGGPVRDAVPLYTHVGSGDPHAAATQTKALLAEGYVALKTDPFVEMRQHHRRYMRGAISAQGAAQAVENMAAIREAAGPNVDLLIDCHGNFNVPTAINMARKMEPYDIGWFEEPVPPNSYEALRQVRESINLPICVGERLYTRFDYVPIFKDRLAEYVMPDVVWMGGISELRKVANMAEAYYVPISPHDASGPLNILAGAHTMMTVPNLYRLEFGRAALDTHNALIDHPLDIRDGVLHLSERPGLGVELDVEYMEAHPDPDWR